MLIVAVVNLSTGGGCGAQRIGQRQAVDLLLCAEIHHYALLAVEIGAQLLFILLGGGQPAPAVRGASSASSGTLRKRRRVNRSGIDRILPELRRPFLPFAGDRRAGGAKR